MFCALALVFSGIEGVESRFPILRSWTSFRRCRVCRVPFSYFARPNPFSALPRASGPVFIFCALGLVFNGTEGVGSRFHDLRARTHFRLDRGRWSRFHVLRARTRFRRYRWRRVPFFLILRARTRFRQYRGRCVPFSCLALPDSFSAVPRVSGPVFMFYSPGLIFGGTECAGSRIHIWRSRTHLRRYRGCQVPFSCFVLPDSFSTVPSVSGPVFMFCASGLVFDDTEGVGYRFYVLRSLTRFRRYRVCRGPVFTFCARTRFRRYRARQIPFSYFALPNSFSTVSMKSGTVFLILRARTSFRHYRGRRVPISYFALRGSFSTVPRSSGLVFILFRS
jgi:hypothetical protein